MSYTIYPTGNDLMAFVIAANVCTNPPSGPLSMLDWSGRMARAVAQFEGDTGRTFIAQSGTRIYDPPLNTRGILDLKGELIQLTSVTNQGATLVLNTDFYMGPNNNDQLNPPRPWTWVEFLDYFPSPSYPYLRHSIAVTGLWGFSTTIPAEVWDGMLSLGAWLCYPELALAINQGRSQYKIGQEMDERMDQTLVREAAGWKEKFTSAVQCNKRLTGML